MPEWSGLRSFASKKDSSRRHFDRWASRYERDRVSRWIETLRRTALETLALEPGDALLDVGCGTGAAVRTAAGTVQRAVGVDRDRRRAWTTAFSAIPGRGPPPRSGRTLSI